jgi:hypothetical protein
VYIVKNLKKETYSLFQNSTNKVDQIIIIAEKIILKILINASSST